MVENWLLHDGTCSEMPEYLEKKSQCSPFSTEIFFCQTMVCIKQVDFSLDIKICSLQLRICYLRSRRLNFTVFSATLYLLKLLRFIGIQFICVQYDLFRCCLNICANLNILTYQVRNSDLSEFEFGIQFMKCQIQVSDLLAAIAKQIICIVWILIVN